MARRPRTSRAWFDRGFGWLCVGAASSSVFVLAVLLAQTFWQGVRHINWTFLTGSASADPATSGIGVAAVGTILTCAVCAAFAIPVGVATAILLEEYRPHRPFLRKLHGFVQLNLTNLAGVPSVVYGLLGLALFVYAFGWFGPIERPRVEVGVAHYDRFPTVGGRTVLAPVPSRDAPPTRPGDVRQFYDAVDERPVEVEVVSGEQFRPRIEQATARATALVDELIAKADLPADVAAAREAVRRAWGALPEARPLTGEVEALVAEQVRAARGAEGRRLRKAKEAAVEALTSADLKARFPLTLLDDAVPQDHSVSKPWYFRLPLGRSVMAAGLTLMLVVLPVVIVSSQEALRAVPNSLRMASLAMGATPWQTIWRVTLPAAVPSVLTGVILAMSRAIGEAAPMLIIAGLVFIPFFPQSLMDDFTVMPLQIYNWVSRPQAGFRDIAAAGIILLLLVLMCFNGLAIYLRQRAQRHA